MYIKIDTKSKRLFNLNKKVKKIKKSIDILYNKLSNNLSIENIKKYNELCTELNLIKKKIYNLKIYGKELGNKIEELDINE